MANGSGSRGGAGRAASARRLTTETKAGPKTTEFMMTVGTVIAILISAALIKGGDTGEGTDEFIARHAWLYVAIVVGAYSVGRGLAKSGSYDPYTDDDGDND